MENILSQSEVTALLQAINQGDVHEEMATEAVGDGACTYDLTTNERIIRGRMPTLDLLSQRLARLIGASFFSLYRRNVEVTHESTRLVKYSEFIVSVSVPACLNVFRMPPLRSACLVAVDSELIFGLVDHVFGGQGSRQKVEGREFSAIELRLVRQVVESVLKDLAEAWSPVVEIRPEFTRTELNPQFVAIASPTDVVVRVVYQLEIEGTNRGSISLLIPYSAIEPIRPLLSSALKTEQASEDNGWTRNIMNVVRSVFVDFQVGLGEGHVMLRDLMSLQVGDTLRLNVDAGACLPCRIEGVEKAFGFPVKSRGKVAVRLDSAIGTTSREGSND